MMFFGVTLAMTGCGGDSDSSGDKELEYKPYEHSRCVMYGKNITVKRDSKPCRLRTYDLNLGRDFSLTCTEITDKQLGTFDDFTVISYKVGTDIDGVVQDIAHDIVNTMQGTSTYKTKYTYQCK